MKRILFYYAIALIMLMLSSCASSGKQFNYTNRSQLLIGKTTKDEALKLLGEPSEIGSVSNKDGYFEILNYMYAHKNFSMFAPKNMNVTAGRNLKLEFRNGLLNAHYYLSDFADDSTDFNIENSSKIKIGVSSQPDVEIIMGTPSGKFLCPSSKSMVAIYSEKCKLGVEGWTWQYLTISKGSNNSTNKFKSVFLVITFNESKIVSDIQRNIDNSF